MHSILLELINNLNWIHGIAFFAALLLFFSRVKSRSDFVFAVFGLAGSINIYFVIHMYLVVTKFTGNLELFTAFSVAISSFAILLALFKSARPHGPVPLK